jgi:hypothetical protein
MLVILIEGVLFVAAIAIVAALAVYAAKEFTPLGVMMRQTQNRKQLERAAELTCPIHGLRPEVELIRMPNGERVCPDCYKETLNGNLD